MLVLIDNYDSFTYNLAQCFWQLGEEVRVIRNDSLDLAGLERLAPSRLVVSPGPCTPNEAGISLAAINAWAGRIPILGVCLGHQSIGQAFGARIVRAPVPMHGKLSELRHSGTGLFAGLPHILHVTRYHSLVIAADSLPDCLEVTAWTESATGAFDVIMAVQHRDLAIHGVQFHPESYCTEQGLALLARFLELPLQQSVRAHASNATVFPARAVRAASVE
jgi:anthranilate synthase/aminodeoxychorismate synthase-like glutamine amidotransferase